MDKIRQFLSLEEVADELSVNYQLIYKLVRSGELSAIKVGRVYRVNRDDLEKYLKESRVRGPSGFVCSVCKTKYESDLSVGSYNSKTGEPICIDCTSRKKIRE